MAVIRAKQQFPEEYIHPKGINYNLNLQFAFIPRETSLLLVFIRFPHASLSSNRAINDRPLKRLIKAARNRATSEL